MNRWTSLARYSIAMASITLLIVTTVAGSPPTQARTVLESGFIEDCYCRRVTARPYYWAFGLVEDIRDDEWEHVIGRELIVFRALGRDAPKPGTRIRMDFDVHDFQRTTSGLAYCAKFEKVEFADDRRPYRCNGIEDGTAVRYIGAATEEGRLGGIPFERLCTQPRDIYDIMDFFEEIELDKDRCYREIAEALDLVDPFQPTPGPEGCNGGNPLGLLWPTAGLVLLARRRRTPPPV